MTDATLPVTQSSLEAFTREYLHTLGASVREDGSHWRVRLPDHVNVSFADEAEFTITLQPPSEGTTKGYQLAPDTDFTHQLLEEAASMSPVGQVAVTHELIEEYQTPGWITESTLQIEDRTFMPYYDRTAVFTLVKISVETVSDYQTQFLQSVTIDTESTQTLPGLAETVINTFYDPNFKQQEHTSPNPDSDSAPSPEIGPDTFEETVVHGQTVALEQVQEDVKEIQAAASRAADSEFDEYRQLQEQRLNDIQDQLDSITTQLENVATDVDAANSHEQRMEALQKRETLQEEQTELQDKQDTILREKRNGFAEKRQEIYERHQLDIRTTPVASTVITYERGELEFQLQAAQSDTTLQVPYAVGMGTTGDNLCEQCQTTLSAENPIIVVEGELACSTCT